MKRKDIQSSFGEWQTIIFMSAFKPGHTASSMSLYNFRAIAQASRLSSIRSLLTFARSRRILILAFPIKLKHFETTSHSFKLD